MSISDIDANHYKNNSTVQFKLAEDILSLHSFKEDEDVLDIGCGEGKLSFELAKRVKKGSVLGIDPSFSMIALANVTFPKETISNLTFMMGAAESFKLEKQYDLITAFSCLHWVRGQEMALKNITNHLSSKGRILVLTFPKESPYFRIFEETIYSAKWSQYAHTSACEYWLTVSEYNSVLESLNLKKHVFRVIREDALYKNQNHFKDYARGWLECRVSMPKHKQ